EPTKIISAAESRAISVTGSSAAGDTAICASNASASNACESLDEDTTLTDTSSEDSSAAASVAIGAAAAEISTSHLKPYSLRHENVDSLLLKALANNPKLQLKNLCLRKKKKSSPTDHHYIRTIFRQYASLQTVSIDTDPNYRYTLEEAIAICY